MITCECCDRQVPSHKWGKVRAHTEGWYFLKDGRVYCPDHRPDYAPRRAAS